jgi:hypothetical protein
MADFVVFGHIACITTMHHKWPSFFRWTQHTAGGSVPLTWADLCPMILGVNTAPCRPWVPFSHYGVLGRFDVSGGRITYAGESYMNQGSNGGLRCALFGVLCPLSGATAKSPFGRL